MVDKITDEILRRLDALEEQVAEPGAGVHDDDRRLPTSAVAIKYQTSTRTVERWTADPKLGFPQPIYINGRKFWSLNELRAWDRQRVRMATQPPQFRKRS
jgi:hypothetical protein